MKFFCEQCKAKYQIADEKVAGKTVRMKCRKCGHVIELRAEVTESSAIAHAPGNATAGAPATGGPASAGGASMKPGAPRPPARPPSKPSALATSLTATKPAAPRTERSAGGALAGAFRTNVQRDEEGSAPFDMADLAPGDDWYVAVNGVPVGPIRIGEVRRKAALGAVTEDSLVWQEGLDEWRPLKTFPDLAANVREAAASGRISITPPPPDVRPSAPPPPPRAPSMRTSSAGSGVPSRVSSSRPLHPPAPAARSNVVPFTSRLATAERLDDAPTEIGTMAKLAAPVADPFALPPPAAAAAAAIAPPGDRPPIVASASVAPSRSDERRKQPPWIIIAMLLGAVAFGTVAALSIFIKPAPAPVAQGAAAPPVTAPTAVATASVAAAPIVAPTDPTASVAAAPAAPAAHGPAIATGPHPASAPSNPGRSLDLHSLAGSNVVPGEDPGGDAPAAPGQCLSGGQVSQVIGNHQLAIRRACWERNPTVKPTVNVSVSLTVGPDGSAQNVSTSGDELSVAKCIENDVRGWRFPPMGCSQKTGFSFKFVRQ